MRLTRFTQGITKKKKKIKTNFQNFTIIIIRYVMITEINFFLHQKKVFSKQNNASERYHIIGTEA